MRGAVRGGMRAMACGIPLVMVLAACGDGGTSSPGPDAIDAEVAGDVVADLPGEVDPDARETGGEDVPAEAEAIDPAALELVDLGKERLSAGESLAAMDAFDLALRKAPGLQDAVWGMVLARFQANVAMFGSAAGLIKLKDDPDAPTTATARIQRSWVSHPGTIGVSIDSLHDAATRQAERLDLLKAAADNPVFSLPGGLPLAFGDDRMMTLCCSWDRSDAYAISAFNHAMFALVAFLGSQDTDVDFGRLERLFKDLGLGTAATQTLVEFPQFLTLLPGGGEEAWRSLKDHLAAAADDSLQAASLMEQDNGLQDNVATLDVGGTGNLWLHGTFPSGATGLEVLWEGSQVSLKRTVTKVKAHLGGDRAQRLGLDGDVAVALGVLVDVVNRTVGLASVASSLGFNLPDMVTGMLGSLDPEDPEQLVGLVGSLLPLLGMDAGSVELDLLTFVETPFNVRDLLPNDGPVPGSSYRGFLKSFECVKGGVAVEAGDGADTMRWTVQDPSSSAMLVPLEVRSYASADGTGEAFDSETVPLQAMSGFTGVFQGTVALSVGDAVGPANDGALVMPAGGSVAATFASEAHPESTVAMVGNATDGYPAYAYGDACADATTPWDGPHFDETEFAGAVEVSAPGQSVAVRPVEADGKALRAGVMAFRSPSMDGLLWLKDGDAMKLSDQALLGAWVNRVLSALESF